jgi:hypothetical protein
LDDDHDDESGWCKRYAPRPYFGVVPDQSLTGSEPFLSFPLWPETDVNEWCGEWAAREE